MNIWDKRFDPTKIKPDDKGHRTRYSDSSMYDEVCILCGRTDGMGDHGLEAFCINTWKEEI